MSLGTPSSTSSYSRTSTPEVTAAESWLADFARISEADTVASGVLIAGVMKSTPITVAAATASPL
jgi:hypothetical protein